MLASAKRGMKHLADAWHVWPALLMLDAIGCIHARGQKTFLLNLYRLNRHSSRACAVASAGRDVVRMSPESAALSGYLA